MNPQTVHIIGGGLAGSEAAWQVAEAGFAVELHEMRPSRSTAAHKTDRFAELVCSNSLKSEQVSSAPWLLKEELRRLGSLLLRAAATARVPGGQALTVDREVFSAEVSAAAFPWRNLSQLAGVRSFRSKAPMATAMLLNVTGSFSAGKAALNA